MSSVIAVAVKEIQQVADLVRVSDSTILSSSALYFNDDRDLVSSLFGADDAPRIVRIPAEEVGADGAASTRELMYQTIYLENNDGPSTKVRFVVQFCAETHEVGSASCYESQSGNTG